MAGFASSNNNGIEAASAAKYYFVRLTVAVATIGLLFGGLFLNFSGGGSSGHDIITPLTTPHDNATTTISVQSSNEAGDDDDDDDDEEEDNKGVGSYICKPLPASIDKRTQAAEAEEAAADHDENSSAKNTGRGETTTTKMTTTTTTTTTRTTGLTPLVAMADPRVGSNLFFRLLRRLGNETPTTEFELHTMQELFRPPNQGLEIEHHARLATLLMKSCQCPGGGGGGGGDGDGGNISVPSPAFTEEEMDLDHEAVVDLLHRRCPDFRPYQDGVDALDNRTADPWGLLDFLTRVPSHSERAYVAFKVFEFHLVAIHLSPSEFVTQAHDRFGARKFLVIWRRRIIESFVSAMIGFKTKGWVNRTSTAADAISISRSYLEKFVNNTKSYFRSIHNALRNLTEHHPDVEYEIVEYDKDLLYPDDQVKTMDRIQRFLNPDHKPVDSKTLVESLNWEKQAKVPLEEQVKNWDEVTEWGYGATVDDWEDIFQQAG